MKKSPVVLACAAALVVASLFAGRFGWAQTSMPAVKHLGAWGVDLAGMDTTVKPGDDFNEYVNGGWMKSHTIPADRARYGAFDQLREDSEVAVRGILEALPAKNPAPGSDEAKLIALYASYLDVEGIEKKDAAPIQPMLGAIRGIKDKGAFTEFMGRAMGSYGGAIFGPRVGGDEKNPDYNALSIGQAGLSLPDRDYYLKPNFAEKKVRYQQYVAQMLGLAGWAEPEKAAADIVAFETKLAEVQWSRAQGRDREKTYNPMTLAELQAYAPDFEWKTFLDAAGVGSAPKIIVGQNNAFPKIAKVYADTDLETLKSWEAFKVIDEAAPLLSRRFSDASFEFKGKYLTGVPEQRERAKRAVAFTEGVMGEAIGREYVAQYFPAESKAKMEALVGDIQRALHARIENLTWMTPETREKAIAKLSKFHVKIGYPSKWRDYSALEVVLGDLFGNALRARKFAYEYQVSKLGQPVDKAEWGMTPQTVNAYYNSTGNEIVFPAAILQPPFFDPDADPAVNFGAIGGVIGHEITHGFDDQGRKSDGDGYLRDWWTLDDAQKFEVQAFKLGTQYESYEFRKVPNFRIIGKLTMGENIADLGGALLGLDAYHLSLGGKEAPVLDGFTGDQRVFLGWAQVWRSLTRDAALQQQLTTEPHSPGQIRAFAPLRNVDAWYKAFNVQPGEKLYLAPEDRVRIW
jgi:putative endopeptidase